ncbi:MAG: AMP-binding protein [Desulfovibrio sp.]|nr:AMP-binding protein [Desulfovibrio sp.]
MTASADKGRYLERGGVCFQDACIAYEARQELARLAEQGKLPAGGVPLPWIEHEGRPLCAEAVLGIQAKLLQELLDRLATESAFYKDMLAQHAETAADLRQTASRLWQELAAGALLADVAGLEAGLRQNLARLPMTRPADIADMGRFVCGSQDRIDRIVTLSTSGTTGTPKRLAFTETDLMRTARFFANGMAQIVAPGERLLVCLPGSERPGGVADLLKRGLELRGTRVEALASPRSGTDGMAELLDAVRDFRPHSLVMSPRQLEGLYAIFGSQAPEGLQSLLVSSDWCDPALAEKVRQAWDIEIIDHYGITESCFGAALECVRHDGMHIRHLDMLVEIVDPVTGESLPAGKIGEIVFTTLRQEAMPLLRYRTGDASWLVPGPCVCQSPSARLGSILGRFEEGSRHINHPLKAERCHVLAGADPFEACTGAGS